MTAKLKKLKAQYEHLLEQWNKGMCASHEVQNAWHRYHTAFNTYRYGGR